MSEKSKYEIDEHGHQYGVQNKMGWDIDTSDHTQRESDFGHIPGSCQFEESVDVSPEVNDNDKDDDDEK